MKYEVVLCIGDCEVSAWKFKSITQVCRYISECNLGLITAHVFRLKDYKELCVDCLMEVWND